jgi:PiT family inorganic phosphate transporter
MAAAVTVIIASQLGLPVSSTHIAVGGIFGIGFLREYLKANYSKIIHDIEHHHTGRNHDEVEQFLNDFESASMADKRQMLDDMKKHTAKTDLTKKERKALGRVYRQELVKRSALKKIAAAWLITVPASALMAAILFFTLRGMMLP